MTAPTIETALGGYEPPDGAFGVGVVDHRGCGGWGVCPIGFCGNPDRCGEKVEGLGDDDLALVDYRPAGAA